jgi:hypothetical protein
MFLIINLKYKLDIILIMSNIKTFIESIDNMSKMYDTQSKKTVQSYNKLIFKRFINYYSLLLKNKNLNSFIEIKNYLNENESNINLKYINNNDINFFNDFVLNKVNVIVNDNLYEFILINNIKDKITNKTAFVQFINDIKHLLEIEDINSLKKLDDFFDNYENLLCNTYKQSENFKGPFIDVYKISSDKIKEINNILDSYKTKKK